MTREEMQSIVETAVMGIVSQGGPSAVFDGQGARCQYLSQSGRRCAIGLFLNDVSALQNCMVAESYEVQDALMQNGVPVRGLTDIAFLQGLQNAHDFAATESLVAHQNDFDAHVFFRRFSLAIEKICTEHELRFPGELI